MEKKIKQLKELFNQRDEIDNQIAEILGEAPKLEYTTKPAPKKKYVVKKKAGKECIATGDKKWSKKKGTRILKL